jgi:alpha-beta hydrolase superfamily lysophospholipase
MRYSRQTELAGTRGRIVLHEWPGDRPRYVALIAHGYGEHAGRYAHVAEHLVRHGGSIYAPDHLGHGRSEGERVLVERVEDLVDDLHAVARKARGDHPARPVVLIGHSMGGLIATRYAQLHGSELAALVLSGPAIGANAGIEAVLTMDPIPDLPIDPSVLSRDPEVGRAYQDDPLVWHGPFRRPTLEALFATVRAVAAGPRLGTLPTLWLHGEDDALVPLAETRAAVERIRGERLESIVYPGARHEVLNETNRSEVLAAVTAFLDRALAVS